jgi:hypothetical protein
MLFDTRILSRNEASLDSEYIIIKMKDESRMYDIHLLDTLPCWNNVTSVYCLGSKLKTLPNWENVISVDCDSCKFLIELPCWPNVINVNCSNCPSLKKLPCWPNVDMLDCSECPLLTELPCWPDIYCVDCSRCQLIVKLPRWTEIGELYCEDTPIKYFPIFLSNSIHCDSLLDIFGIKTDYNTFLKRLIIIRAGLKIKMCYNQK